MQLWEAGATNSSVFSGVCLGVALSENHQQADNHEIKIME